MQLRRTDVVDQATSTPRVEDAMSLTLTSPTPVLRCGCYTLCVPFASLAWRILALFLFGSRARRRRFPFTGTVKVGCRLAAGGSPGRRDAGADGRAPPLLAPSAPARRALSRSVPLIAKLLGVGQHQPAKGAAFARPSGWRRACRGWSAWRLRACWCELFNYCLRLEVCRQVRGIVCESRGYPSLTSCLCTCTFFMLHVDGGTARRVFS